MLLLLLLLLAVVAVVVVGPIHLFIFVIKTLTDATLNKKA